MNTPSPSVSPSIYEQDDPLSRDLGETGLSDDDDDETVGPDGSLDRPKIERTGTTASTISMTPSVMKKDKGGNSKKGRHYELSRESDVVGVIFLEINCITDLPPERNSELNLQTTTL